MQLTVVIPAYNEEKRLPETLKRVRDYLEKQSYDWEVLIVNDGSKDMTAGVVSELIKEWSGFRLIDNGKNKGKGGVVRQGMLEAKGDWRLFMDADNSTDISELPKLMQFANQKSKLKNQKEIQSPNYEIIVGSRYLDEGSIKVKQPLMRRMISRLGNWLIRIMLGIKMVDTQCGFKLFSAKATQDIFPQLSIERWGFDMEMLAIAIKKGYKIKEVAVDWYDAEGSSVKKSAALKTLKELWTIKWNLIRGKYR